MKYFQTVFLESADEFIEGIGPKAKEKILYNIMRAEQYNSSRLFKKLRDDIWEFRVRHGLTQKNKIMAKEKVKVYTLDEMIDKHIGKKGTPARDKFEYKVNMELLGHMIRKARKERNLTQQQLGKLVGVQKAQISKLESRANSARIDTIFRVFKALKADISFSIKMENEHLQLK